MIATRCSWPATRSYLEPGHIPVAEAGTEILQFSPSLELEAVSSAMVANMRAMQGA